MIARERECMKVIKKVLYSIVALLILCCMGILACALNPSLTESLAAKVQQLQTRAEKPGTEQAGAEGEGLEVTDGPAQNPGDYVVPDAVPQDMPEGVIGLNGFRPVTGENQQIAQEEADNLGSILTSGVTGEGFSFSAEQYPYYAMLDDTLQRLYRQVYANALELNISFVPVAAVTTEQVKMVVEAVYNDHPEIFWLDAEFGCKYLATGICVEITLEYNDTVNDLETAKQDFAACAEELLSGAASFDNNYEKERYIHDVLVQIVEYDASEETNQSAYSAIVLGKTVCAGYARAFQYLLQQLGIPCYYCAGYAGEDHAWNIVRMGGIYRNVDVTWDDTDPSTYDYFNKSDSEFAATHVRTGLSVYLPACEDIRQDETEAQEHSIVDDHINPDPQKPLTWHSRGKVNYVEDTQESREEKKRENLAKAGITEEDVLETLDAYYADCGKRLKEAGIGEQQFTNVIPESLWSAVERAYSGGGYRSGYADNVLKELKGEEFLIQLQVQRLGGGYYRLYHSVYTY